jgi:hypothetical protein
MEKEKLKQKSEIGNLNNNLNITFAQSQILDNHLLSNSLYLL